MLKFEKGDCVVAPGCGVGHVEAIEVMEMDKKEVPMYRIRVEDNDVVMWIPHVAAGEQGLRTPMKATKIDSVLEDVRKTTAPLKRATWNRRQRRYREQIMSNDPSEIGKLLGELSSARQRKPLSFGERLMFERARKLLEHELLVAAKVPSTVSARLDEALAA